MICSQMPRKAETRRREPFIGSREGSYHRAFTEEEAQLQVQLDMDSYAFSPSPSPLLEPMLLTVSPPNSGGSSTTPPNGIEKRSNLSMAVNIGLLRADADEDEFGDVLSAALRRGRSTNQSAKSRSANRRRRWYLGIQSKKDQVTS